MGAEQHGTDAALYEGKNEMIMNEDVAAFNSWTSLLLCYFTSIQVISHVENQVVHLQVVLVKLWNSLIADGSAKDVSCHSSRTIAVTPMIHG
jgi:hypothetical protein